jgi:hypothetical protein
MTTAALAIGDASAQRGRYAVAAMFLVNGFLMGSWAPQILVIDLQSEGFPMNDGMAARGKTRRRERALCLPTQGQNCEKRARFGAYAFDITHPLNKVRSAFSAGRQPLHN